MKRLLTVLALALSLQASARDVLELIRENPNNSAVVFTVYSPLDTVDTPAPKGYEPFYISHIGRHGSRYHATRWKKTIDGATAKFNAFAEAGALTEEGLKVRDALNAFSEAHSSHWGKLSPLGALEHREIARRLYTRFPQVFNNPSKTKINSYNSGADRVVESQNNFISMMKSLQPSLEFSTFSPRQGEEYKVRAMGSDLSKEDTEKAYKETVDASKKKALTLKFDDSRLASLLFVDGKNTNGYSSRLFRSLWQIFVVKADIPEDIYDVLSLYTPEELHYFWAAKNFDDFVRMGNCTETKAFRPLHFGGAILKTMIEDADESIASGVRPADFRFSHDTYIQSLLSFIGGEGNEEHPAADANKYWNGSLSVCMAVNVDLVLYCSPNKKDILVKVLHNEKEISLPDLKPVAGPYYKWNDFKKYYQSKAK